MKADVQIKISNLLSKGADLTESEVLHLMLLIRKYLEYPNKNHKRFLRLNFFCDWASHITLDRSIPALEMLVELNAVIYELRKISNNDLLMKKVTQVISFPLLKKDLHNFFKYIEIEDKLTINPTIWENFVSKYIEIILDCLLLLPESISKRIKPYYDKLVSKQLKDGCWTIGLSVSKIDQNFFKGIRESLSGKAFICLILYESNTTRIVIPLTKEDVLK